MVISAPRSNGRCSTGVRKVLSTTAKAPCSLAKAQLTSMSVNLRVGLAGDSNNSNRVGRNRAAAVFVGSEVSTNSQVTPSFARISVKNR